MAERGAKDCRCDGRGIKYQEDDCDFLRSAAMSYFLLHVTFFSATCSKKNTISSF